MAALGPLLGGFLTTEFTPGVGVLHQCADRIVAVVGACAFAPVPDADEEISPGLDVLGAVLSAVGIGLLVFGLIEGRNYGWWTADHRRPVPVAGLAGRRALAGGDRLPRLG